MPTNIVFRDGREITVAEAVEDVAAAAHGPQPAMLESAVGARMVVNWEHVAYAVEIPPEGPGAAIRAAHVHAA